MIRYSGVLTVTGKDPSLDKLRKEFTFENPVYKILKRSGKHRWTSPYIRIYESNKMFTAFPRGALPFCVPDISEPLNVFPLEDTIDILPEVMLRKHQEDAYTEIIKADNGYVRMPTSSGKTLTMINLAVKLKQKTLILMDKTSLVEQWVAEIQKFTGYSAGKIHSKSKHLIKDITVATYQSVTEEIINQFSVVIVDEAHHAVAGKFKGLLMKYKGKHLYGCTATNLRSDGVPVSVIFGGKLYEIGESELVDNGTIMKPKYYQVLTPYTVGYNENMSPSEMYSLLLNNIERNKDIAHMAASLFYKGKTMLLLTQRIEHANVLSKMLQDLGVENEIIFGGVKESRRQEIIQSIRDKDLRCLIGSTVADEGLDIPSLDTILLTSPAKFKGKMIQRVGRVVRTAVNKKIAEIYDIADMNEGVFIGQFNSRWDAMKEYFGLQTFKKIDIRSFK